ncbi:MAG: TetR/AcrR family transcriptional regulator [Bacteroidota bacterium]
MINSVSVNLKINPNLCLRDPQKTNLGQKILQHSILLIHEYGLEQFTFKKLAKRIDSTEASIYRYFENKHILFIYLLNWYWEWVRFRIELQTLNVKEPIQRLKTAVRVLVDATQRSMDTAYIDEDILHKIVVSEGTKGYHSISVDEENREGFFLAYKALCKVIADLVLAINPNFPYPRSLASMLIETANNNLYFSMHLPRLTDIEGNDPDLNKKVGDLLEFIVFKLADQDGTHVKDA